jgi:hypothetical protein
MANNTLLASDNFASGSLAAGWSAVHGETVGQVVNVPPRVVEPVTTSAYAEQIWTGLVFPNDHISEVTVNSFIAESNTQFSLLVRFQTATQSGYAAHVGGGSSSVLQVFRYDSGTATQLNSNVSVTVAAGDVWTMCAAGSGIIVYQNGTRRFYWPDTTYTSGSPGFGNFSSVNVSHVQISSWRGYSVVQQDGIWTKQKIAIPALAGDYTATNPPSAGTYIPTQILFEGNAQVLSGTVYKMWFGANFGATGGIYYAESLDGINWTRRSGQVIAGFLGPAIIKNGSTYYMYVQSATAFGTGNYFVFTSTDGINWTNQGDTGIGLGAGGAWDSVQTFTMAPVTIINGTWYGLYSATNLGTGPTGDIGKTGLVTSSNGINWTKYVSNPVLNGWVTQATVNVNGIWYTWIQQNQLGQGSAFGGLDPTESVRYSSPDLINWTKSAQSIHHSQMYEGVSTNTGQSFINSLITVGGQTYAYLNSDSNDGAGPQIYQISLATAPATIAQIVTQNEDAAQQIATDPFTSGLGPLSSNWTVPTTGTAAKIVAGPFVEPTALNQSCEEVFTGAAFSPNQYSEVAIHTYNTNAAIVLAVRASTNALTCYNSNLFQPGAPGSAITAKIATTVNGVTTQFPATATMAINPGDVIRLQVITGSDGFPVISLFQNGFLILQVQDYANTLTSGNPSFWVFAINALADMQISSWAGGNANVIPTYGPTGTGYSVPDSRAITATTPNSARVVQGTLIYDVPKVFSLMYWFDTLFNRTQPLPVDSRVSKPVDSRQAANIPQNSRTPGVFGPGQ